MTPCFSAFYFLNGSYVNAIGLSDFFGAANIFPNCRNINLRNFGFVIFFSACLSAFFNHVPRISSSSIKKEVIGIYADSIVAMMTNAEPRRDFASEKLKRKPMCVMVSPFNVEKAIAVAIARGNPLPASYCSRLGINYKPFLPRQRTVRSNEISGRFGISHVKVSSFMGLGLARRFRRRASPQHISQRRLIQA